jgi:hypothetical protein
MNPSRNNSVRAFPAFSAEVMEALEAAFPDKLPIDRDVTPSSIAALVGQQEVLRFMRARLEANLRAQR